MRTVLHCGYYKCGSTALQHCLTESAKDLASQDILYPAAGREKLESHSALAFALLAEGGLAIPQWFLNLYPDDGAPGVNELAAQMRDEIAMSDCSEVVVSSEEFTRVADLKDPIDAISRLSRIFDGGDITVVFYLRRPDTYLLSWYSQLLRIGETPGLFRQALKHFIRSLHGEFARAVEPWIAVFGQDRVVLRNYGELVSGDICEDFGSLIGAPLTSSGELEINRSIPTALFEVFRRGNLASRSLPYRELRLEAIEEMRRAQIWRQVETVNVDHFGDEGRQLLYESFLPTNVALGKLAGRGNGFFGDLDEVLKQPDEPVITVQQSVNRFQSAMTDATNAVLLRRISTNFSDDNTARSF